MLQVNHPYTWAELEAFTDDPALEGLKLKGYVLRADMDGMFTFVKWTEASYGGYNSDLPGRTYTIDKQAAFGEPEPIVKRTAAQRVDSLMLKFIDDCKQAGTVPGITDAKISEILGEAWKSGNTQITADVVRRVAAHFLAEAEARAKEAARHHVTSAPTS